MLRETRSTLLSATGGAPAHPTMAGSPRDCASRAAIRFLSSPIGTSRMPRRAAHRGLAGDHAPDHDRVVPGLDHVMSHAFDEREGAIEQDPDVLPPVITNPLEAIVVRIRETAGEGLLMARQDVDHELVRPGDE